MTDVSVLIPYGYRSDWEYRLFEYVVERWQRDFPQWEVVIGSGGHPFNRSRARNDAASKASGNVFVICDADTTYLAAPAIQGLTDIVLTNNRKWFLPASYLQTTERWTLETISGANISDIDKTREYVDQPGGWRICSAEAFLAVGGFDEGFEGWGYEDTAFALALDAVYGHPQRSMTAIHLWHPTPRGDRQEQPAIRRNAERFRRYQVAQRKGSVAMRGLLENLDVLP